MDKSLSTQPEAVFELVKSSDQVEDRRKALAAEADDQPGVQCEIQLNDLLEEPYDAILRSMKLNSRWGSDLSEIYKDSIRSLINDTTEGDVVSVVESAFEKTDADPYEAAATGEALTIGFDIKSALQEQIENWEEEIFNEDDVAAGLTFAADQEGIKSKPTIGTAVLYSSTPLSELSERDRRTSNFTSVIQSLLLLKTKVRIVAPRGRADERDFIEDQFRQVGSFSIEEHGGTSMQIENHVKEAIDSWYDQLCYDVEHKRVAERVVRPASVTAYDLPPEPELDHFVNSITIGLQGKYSEKKYDEERFEELWQEQVTPHDRYNQYRSKRQSFPRVTVGRDDNRTKVFRLHHEGPSTQPRLNGTPLQTDDAEQELIDLIVRFLNAEVTDNETWTELRNTVDQQLATNLPINTDTVAEYALLRSRRVRTKTTPRLPPFNSGENPSDSTETAREEAWYREHWATILSGYRLTKGVGVNIISAKEELCHSLDPESPADRALFYKLQTDIENAWEYYPTALEEQLQASLPDELETTINTDVQDDRTNVHVTVHPPDADPMETNITIYLPYSDVRVNGKEIPRATVSNTVAKVLEMFEGILYIRPHGLDNINEVEALYDVIRVYCETVDAGENDVIYFDEVIEFCLSLPGLWECFQRPNRSLRAAITEALGQPELIQRLRDQGVRFHRKGSDDHGSVKVRGDQYIAMELRTDDL